MDHIQAFLVGLFVFWVLLYIIARFFKLERWGLEIRPAYLIYRSERLRKSLDVVSQSKRRLLRALSNVSLVLASGLMIYVIYWLTDNVLRFLQPVRGGGSRVFLVIPGITIGLPLLPYFLVSGAIIVITHEVAHGLVARLENIPVKSAGVILALVIPGGFVEPDEEEFERSSTLSKLRVLSAGSSTNLVTGLLALLLLVSLYAPASGILVLETMEGGPLDVVGLRGLDVIYAINETKVPTILRFSEYMSKVKVEDVLVLKTNRGNITITAIGHPKNASRAIVGLSKGLNYRPLRFGDEGLISLGYYTHMTLEWIYMLALGAALFMMLPIYPFDGDKFLYYFLKDRINRGLREIRALISVICGGLMITNLVLSFMRYGLIFF